MAEQFDNIDFHNNPICDIEKKLVSSIEKIIILSIDE
jgi:hypothetical protein